MPVKVDESKCDGCGSCAEVCPVEAITVDQVAKVDATACIDCGSCLDECPHGAISMEEIEPAASSRSIYAPASFQPAPAEPKTLTPNPPINSPAMQPAMQQTGNGGFLGQVANFFSGFGGRGNGQGKGRGRHGGRGRGRRGR